MAYTTEQAGQLNTLSYRCYIKNSEGQVVSPFHDIPTFANEEQTIVNMVCEVPRWTNAKLEITTGVDLNPITQDQKAGKARFVHNCFPHHGYIWNYGAIPQTWENPEMTDSHTNAKGDNDPIDICEIGFKRAEIGEVKQVKVLGIMAMIDEGETDWKVIGIDVNDPLAPQLNDIGDIDKVLPGQLSATNEWFRIYKMPAGKPENTFAFNGEPKNKEFALNIIKETHEQWDKLIKGETVHAKISVKSATVAEAKEKISPSDATALVEAYKKDEPLKEPAPIDPTVDKWHYIKL